MNEILNNQEEGIMISFIVAVDSQKMAGLFLFFSQSFSNFLRILIMSFLYKILFLVCTFYLF